MQPPDYSDCKFIFTTNVGNKFSEDSTCIGKLGSDEKAYRGETCVKEEIGANEDGFGDTSELSYTAESQ